MFYPWLHSTTKQRLHGKKLYIQQSLHLTKNREVYKRHGYAVKYVELLLMENQFKFKVILVLFTSIRDRSTTNSHILNFELNNFIWF